MEAETQKASQYIKYRVKINNVSQQTHTYEKKKQDRQRKQWLELKLLNYYIIFEIYNYYCIVLIIHL